MSRPIVFLVTLFRRYHEAEGNLRRLHSLLGELQGPPLAIVLVWAQPEPARQYLLDEWQVEGLFTHLIKRPRLPQEGPPDDHHPNDQAAGRPLSTSYPESHNIRQGFEYVQKRWPSCYVIGMASDIWLQEGTLGLIDKWMQGWTDPDNNVYPPCRASVFYWANLVVPTHVWHTNLFAVSASPSDRPYWPPLSDPAEGDVLERQWGKSLEGLPDVFVWHNSENRRFHHRHTSEGLSPFPHLPLATAHCLPLCIKGKRTFKQWLHFFWDKLRSFLRGRP